MVSHNYKSNKFVTKRVVNRDELKHTNDVNSTGPNFSSNLEDNQNHQNNLKNVRNSVSENENTNDVNQNTKEVPDLSEDSGGFKIRLLINNPLIILIFLLFHLTIHHHIKKGEKQEAWPLSTENFAGTINKGQNT